MAVLDAHMAALNARDSEALCATLHFPHYRLSGGRLQVWDAASLDKKAEMAIPNLVWARFGKATDVVAMFRGQA